MAVTIMQMRQVSRRYGLTPSTWLVGGLVAFSLSFFWPSLYHGLWDTYDQVRPVAEVTSRVVSVQPEEILFEVTVKKLRDCDLVSRFGIVTLPDGTIARVKANRADGAPLGSLSQGDTLRSTWRVHPLLGTRWLRVFLRYDCDGREVTQQVISYTFDLPHPASAASQ